MKQKTRIRQEAPQLFRDAAEYLLSTYKTPDEFLKFLRDALEWVHNFERMNPNYADMKDPHFNLCYMIDNIVIPWMKAGRKNEIEAVAKGIEDYDSFYGHEEHHDITGNLIIAFGSDFDSGIPTPEWMEKYMRGITAMVTLGNFMYTYEYELKAKAEKSKAA